MGVFTSQYKQRSSTTRTVSGENTYEKGMYFSDQLLKPGYVHTLLNLEIDQLSYSVQVTGGLHTTNIAPGCNFLDRAVFGADSDSIIVLQGRNEYCARAFEGVTNIISVQKLSVKNNQTLEEQIRQQGFTADDVVCYKLLTYNPMNYRLMIITMMQAQRDKHFIINPDYTLRRLQVNPISCGFSDVWSTSEGESYISNITNFHPNGASDYYIPRIRRNSFNETFGQTLYSPHRMKTITHCEGFGNKTLLFTKKKQVDIIGPYMDKGITSQEEQEVYSIQSMELDSWGPGALVLGDILTIHRSATFYDAVQSWESPIKLKITLVNQYGRVFFSWIDRGRFRWAGQTDISWVLQTVTRDGNTQSPNYFGINISTRSVVASERQKIIIDVSTSTLTQVYLRNCNTGISTPTLTEINNILQPIDAYRFGIVLTSIGISIGSKIADSPVVMDEDNLYDKALVNTVQKLGQPASDGTSIIRLNPNTGKIRPPIGEDFTETSLNFMAIPPLRGENKSVNSPTNLFQKISISWTPSTNWVSPTDYIKDEIIKNIRIGQGIRVAAWITFDQTLTRPLNTLMGNPLDSKYYNALPTGVFVLDYVWNGNDWEFSFVDTSVIPDPILVENWGSGPEIVDEIGNRITRHFIWRNNLSYTDIITSRNQDQMAPHIVDTQSISSMLYNQDTEELLKSDTTNFLTYNINKTIQEHFNIEGFNNKSKFFDTTYGHFEAEPRELRASEAARWGYNMLSPKPYIFVCDDTVGVDPTLNGILLMRNDRALLKPRINTPGELYVYIDCDRTAVKNAIPEEAEEWTDGYQLKLEVRGLYDSWTDLKVYTVLETHEGLASGLPFRIPYIGSTETVLVRATLHDRNTKIATISEDGTAGEEFLTVFTLSQAFSYIADPNQIETEPEVYDLGSALGMTYWKSRLVAWGILGAENQLFLSEVSQPEYWPYPNNVDPFEENIIHVIPYSDALIIFTSTKLWRIDIQSSGLSWTKTLLQQNLRISDKDIPYICILKNMLFFKSDKQFYMLVPQRGSTVGDLTIAPISKAIAGFLNNPWRAIKSIIPPMYKELSHQSRPINEFLVQYGSHVEQTRIFVDWWFDLTVFKEQPKSNIGDREIEHDVLRSSKTDDNPKLLPKEYWLVQLVYDTQTYSWTLRTHTTNAIGAFISDAANTNTDFISLVFSPELTDKNEDPIFYDNGISFSRATWGIEVSNRTTPEDRIVQQFTLNEEQIIALDPTYIRFQIFDTGYKEFSNPALSKRFREAQLFLQPRPGKEVEALENLNWLEDLKEEFVSKVAINPELITSEMHSSLVPSTTGDAVAIKALLDVYVDGNQILMSTTPEVQYETQSEGILQIKIVDSYNFITEPFIINSELSNTFLLDNSALDGVKLIRFRRAVNGKGQLIRFRFSNLTESNYAIVGHAFVAHNKNAR